jgi:transcriptional regulator with XRE-family HTH domain
MARRQAAAAKLSQPEPDDGPFTTEKQEVIRDATYFLVRSAFPSDAAIADFAGVDRSRVTRFKQGKNLEPDTDALLGAVSATVTLLRGFLDDEMIPEWLRGINAQLGERMPLDVIRTGRMSEVIAAIEAEKSGAFA